jgi:hypothetical protein
MQTSCGWFFDELTGLEPVQVLRYAARAIELAETLGERLEDGFVQRLEPARSNLPARETGADVYRRAARGAAATPARVAATAAMLALLGEPAEVPGYAVRLPAPPAAGSLETRVVVREEQTGTESVQSVAARLDPAGAPVCRVEDGSFTLADLFGVQRERLLAKLGREAAATALETLRRIRPRLEPLLGADAMPPPEIATLLGWEGAQAIATALAERTRPVASLVEAAAGLRRRGGVFPARWLGARIGTALAERLRELPDAARDVLALLDLAKAAAVRLDLGAAQVQALAWWEANRPPARPGEPLAVLRDRLAIAPEDA